MSKTAGQRPIYLPPASNISNISNTTQCTWWLDSERVCRGKTSQYYRQCVHAAGHEGLHEFDRVAKQKNDGTWVRRDFNAMGIWVNRRNAPTLEQHKETV